MTVFVLTAVPAGLRGQFTRWLLEIAPGVFVGKLSARIREYLWQRVLEYLGTGKALMVWQAKNEQGLEFRTHNHGWEPTDFDGIKLMMRPHAKQMGASIARTSRPGWSKQSRYRRRG